MAVTPIQDERRLLTLIASGDQQSFTVLFEHYHKYVYSFSHKITHSKDFAEEIVQDIFLKIWLNREKLEFVENFGAYLNRLVRNQSFNVLRQFSQETKSNLILRSQTTEVDDSTLRQLDYKEAKYILNAAIETLSPQQRMVYILCHQKGMKYEEAAAKMNISPQTVHGYMKDALKKIREHFKKHTVEYSVFIISLFKLSR